MGSAHTVKYDIHSHILPKMDDGSAGSAESMKMLRELSTQGVLGVVATPHFYPWNDEPESFLERRAASGVRLAEIIKEHGENGLPRVYVGAEVAFYRGIAKYNDLSKLCIMGTNYILIEMPFEKWSRLMVEEVISINGTRSIVPIIAHIERYFAYMDDSMLDMLIDGGCIIQCNSPSFLRFFGKRRLIELVKKEKIHVLGSDCHNMTSRAPVIDPASEFLREKLGDGVIDKLNENAQKVVRNASSLIDLVDEGEL